MYVHVYIWIQAAWGQHLGHSLLFIYLGVVRETGHIVKCFDEVMDDFLVSDELRKVGLSHCCHIS